MLVVPLALWIILTYLVSSVSSLEVYREDWYDLGDSMGSLDESDGNLSKRGAVGALSFTGQSFTQGVKAITKLLKGTKEVPPTNILRRDFVKSGGVERAMHDFYSVNPKNVRSIKGHILLGEVGDVSIMFKRPGIEGKTKSPSLLIYKTDDRDMPVAFSNKIIYKS